MGGFDRFIAGATLVVAVIIGLPTLYFTAAPGLEWWPYLPKNSSVSIVGQTPLIHSSILVMFGLLSVALLTTSFVQIIRQRKPSGIVASPVPTAVLTLRFFGDIRAPERLGFENVFRWYYLRNMFVAIDKKTGKEITKMVANLFVTFDRPVIIGTLAITSPDMTLPTYEVKDFNPRSAVIVFDNEIPSGTAVIRVHQ